MSVETPLVVASDVHLARGEAQPSALRLAQLFQRHAGHEVVLAGDIFNLSVDPKHQDPGSSVREIWSEHPELVAATRAHLARGDALTFIAGNHDAGVVAPGTRAQLLSLCGVTDEAPLRLEPWFIRRGTTHIEHGHVYDPDNAPAHPLAMWSPATEPLGISLTRRFLAPNDAFAFAHAHETTPLSGLKRAFREFGARTPLLLFHYFWTAGHLIAESASPGRLAAEKTQGASDASEFAAKVGLTESSVAQLMHRMPRPTHEDFKRTFLRLYFDRALTAFGVGAGAVPLVFGNPLGGVLALASAAYLVSSVRKGVNRYSNGPVQRLHEGAALVRTLTSAERVIFGHTHCEDEGDGYVNAGSFTYTRRSGSPYLRLDENGRLERREIRD